MAWNKSIDRYYDVHFGTFCRTYMSKSTDPLGDFKKRIFLSDWLKTVEWQWHTFDVIIMTCASDIDF